MKARIAQCLCGPKRHAIIGFAVNDPDMVDAEVEAALRTVTDMLIAGKGKEVPGMPAERINPWCGLCGARSIEWIYEVRWTKEFTNWDQAMDAVKDIEARQQLTAAITHMLGVSYDAQRKRESN